jgi:acetyl esterase
MTGATQAAPINLTAIEYANPNGLSLRLDACIPSGEGPFAAAILVHGGGWVRGDRRVEVAPLFQPLTEAGIAWFTISYRLATSPLVFGEAIADVESAVRFVKAHAAEYRVDPNRIALVGESAGGQLAAMAALNTSPELQVKGVVALYTPTDLVSLANNSKYIPEGLRLGLDGTPWKALILARLAQLSPIEHVHRAMPPFLLIHGTADALVPFVQSSRMCERMKSVGASCEIYAVPNAGHGIRWWEASAADAVSYKKRLVAWLKAHLADASAG